MVNKSTNIVDNVCVWDGNPNTWQPPADYLMLVDDTTPALIWSWDAAVDDWVLKAQMGAGGIGFSWNGTECVTTDPKPPKPEPQPIAQGTQTL